MPIKRRSNKARERLDESKIEDLFYGPGTCLFNGEGYLGAHGDGLWSDKSDDVRAAVMAEMEADWRREGLRIRQAWANRTDHDLRNARKYHGDLPEPWAATQFGEPQ